MDEAAQPVRPDASIASAVGDMLCVTHFREILLWPVHLMPLDDGADVQDYWTHICTGNPDNPWCEVEDEFTGDPAEFQERHFTEFVAFLPPVQRFLYGQGLGKSVERGYGESPIRVLRRRDIAQVRVTLADGGSPIVVDIAHVDLYFFFDIDVAMLALEIYADNLALDVAQELMFQLGRTYPAYWEEDGRAGHCPRKVEWLGQAGEVLAVSDYESRQTYLTFACEHRAPRVAAHWQFMLQPLVLHHTDQKGAIRYRQLEYHRMPMMAYLAIDHPERLTRADNVRLALATGSGDRTKLPLNEAYFAEFEAQHCYDRHLDSRGRGESSSMRYWSCGHSFVVTGDAGNDFFSHLERGYLARFRHEHFLLFLIAHFHKAALAMFSDRLAAAVSQLDVRDATSMLAFRRETRRALETFLRFTHRYWFREVSEQAQTRELFALCRRHLGLDRLYEDIRQEAQDMSQYLENEAMRRQNETVVRLTVITIFGLIGTLVTGTLGMNLFAWADLSPGIRLLLFLLILVPTALATLYTVKKSRRLSEFFDTLSDESLGFAEKWHAFTRIW
jgi:CorA-like Mg2+ transporter protein